MLVPEEDLWPSGATFTALPTLLAKHNEHLSPSHSQTNTDVFSRGIKKSDRVVILVTC